MEQLTVDQVDFAGYRFTLTQQASARFGLKVDLNGRWVQYVSELTRHTYVENLDMKQSVLDGLSPFQIMSKLWATEAVIHFTVDPLGVERPSQYVFVGSWFGQLPAMVWSHNKCPSHFVEAPKVFIDKDHHAMYVSEQCTKRVIPNCDYFPFDLFDGDLTPLHRQMVVWTGMEHFPKAKVEQWIKTMRAVPSTWVVMGTDRPEYDHVNPVRSVDDLEHYFHGGKVLYRGHLSEPTLGNRYLLVCTQ